MDRMLRFGGAAAGIVYVVSVFVGFGLIAGFTPGLRDSRAEVAAYLTQANVSRVYVGEYLEALGHIVFTFFLGALWVRLRAEEADRGWLSATSLSCGVLYVGLSLVGIAVLGPPVRRAATMDISVAEAFMDLRNLLFLLSLAVLAGFLVATAAAVQTTRAFPRWIGWTGALIAVGLLAGEAVPTSDLASTISTLFLLWVLGVSIVMVRGQESQVRN